VTTVLSRRGESDNRNWPEKVFKMNSNTRSPISDPGFIHTADNVRLFYRDWGNGAPLVFLSGWTLNSDMWFYQMVPLTKQGYRCIAYDRRSQARSSDHGD
jgi:hypothetical protein